MIGWLLLAAVASFAVGYFWDELKAWASRVINYILEAINWAIEIASNAFVYLVKQGYRFYKRVEVYIRNRRSGNTTVRYQEAEVSEYEIPEEARTQLNYRSKLAVYQQQSA